MRTADPREVHAAHPFSKLVLLGPVVKPHPRARVWEEERHAYLPAWSLRPIYRLLIPPIAYLSADGNRRGRSR